MQGHTQYLPNTAACVVSVDELAAARGGLGFALCRTCGEGFLRLVDWAVMENGREMISLGPARLALILDNAV